MGREVRSVVHRLCIVGTCIGFQFPGGKQEGEGGHLPRALSRPFARLVIPAQRRAVRRLEAPSHLIHASAAGSTETKQQGEPETTHKPLRFG